MELGSLGFRSVALLALHVYVLHVYSQHVLASHAPAVPGAEEASQKRRGLTSPSALHEMVLLPGQGTTLLPGGPGLGRQHSPVGVGVYAVCVWGGGGEGEGGFVGLQ